MTQTWKDISSNDAQKIKERLLQQINSMNEAELRIVSQSEKALAEYIAGAFQAFAQLLGYVIAYPIALAMRIVKSLGDGFSAGWESAFRNAGVD